MFHYLVKIWKYQMRFFFLKEMLPSMVNISNPMNMSLKEMFLTDMIPYVSKWCFHWDKYLLKRKKEQCRYRLLRSSNFMLPICDDWCSSSEFCNMWCSGKVDFSLYDIEAFVSREVNEWVGITADESNGSEFRLIVCSNESRRWTHLGIVICGSLRVCCFSFD